ncbi:MAG: hypothetical protein Q8O67_26550 [Deltaproteobacteria bacterium]|nr:hypothetical protein [Deltaproteobacteria bacterium]
MNMRLSLSLALVIALAGGCATTSNSGGGDKAGDYFPLAVGNRWTYRIVPGPPEPQQVQILRRDDDGFFVDDRGGRLAPRSDGVFDGQRFLLQEPLAVDHTWTALPRKQAPETYRITATDAVVTVPAGTFSPCVEVRGEQPTPPGAPAGKLLISWTYAKGVGLIRFEQQVQLGSDPPLTTATMELVSFEVSKVSKEP